MAIARKSNNIYIIDTFLLSCRIFGRKVEYTLLAELFKKLKDKTTIINGIFNKSKKNKEFANFFIENGFKTKSKKYFEKNIRDFNYKKSGLFKISYEKN